MGTPKALLAYRGETFVGRLARVLGGVCDSLTVVLGKHAGEIRPHVPPDARIVVNPDPDRGQLSSLQTALTGIRADGFAFIPVDCPLVAEATAASLADAFRQRDPNTLFVIPRMGDKRGHPVFAAQAIAQELLALPPTSEARSVVHKYVSRTHYVDVTDPGIFADIDTPEAYEQLLQGTRP